MNIVVGIAVDFNKAENIYDLSFEVASLAGANKESGIVGRIINAQGKTIFDAIRNAKRKEADKLFFGSPHVLVINKYLASEMGILGVIDFFLRDGEGRESMCVAISQEETAAIIIESTEGAIEMVSVNLHEIMREEKNIMGSAAQMEMYKIFSELSSKKRSVLLPALRKVKNGDSIVSEANGSAIIKEDKLVGFLNPDQSKYALMAQGELKSSIITLGLTHNLANDISLEIFKNKAKKSYKIEDGKIKVKIEVENHVAVSENQSFINLKDEKEVEKVEKAAEEKINKNIQSVVSTMQERYNADVFGFGEMIYKRDLKFWEEISERWDEIYPTLEVEVKSKVKIRNTALIM
jgi:spore germination protein KC